jgi:hypothetical protein
MKTGDKFTMLYIHLYMSELISSIKIGTGMTG